MKLKDIHNVHNVALYFDSLRIFYESKYKKYNATL